MIAIDYFMVALWLILSVRTRAALLPLFVLVIDCLCYWLFDGDFARYCVTSMAYFLASALNIRILSSLRYAFLVCGCIYLVGAVDDMLYRHFDANTFYYPTMPYIVTLLNALVAALLFSAGGCNFAGFTNGLRCVANSLRFGL